MVLTLPRCMPRCQTVPHDNFVICGRGDAGVPLLCDLELTTPTRMLDTSEDDRAWISGGGFLENRILGILGLLACPVTRIAPAALTASRGANAASSSIALFDCTSRLTGA